MTIRLTDEESRATTCGESSSNTHMEGVLGIHGLEAGCRDHVTGVDETVQRIRSLHQLLAHSVGGCTMAGREGQRGEGVFDE